MRLKTLEADACVFINLPLGATYTKQPAWLSTIHALTDLDDTVVDRDVPHPSNSVCGPG